jgi:hypothetical protein
MGRNGKEWEGMGRNGNPLKVGEDKIHPEVTISEKSQFTSFYGRKKPYHTALVSARELYRVGHPGAEVTLPGKDGADGCHDLVRR